VIDAPEPLCYNRGAKINTGRFVLSSRSAINCISSDMGKALPVCGPTTSRLFILADDRQAHGGRFVMREPRACVRCGKIAIIMGRGLCCACYKREGKKGNLDKYPKQNKGHEPRYDYCIDCGEWKHIFGRDRCRECHAKYWRSQPGWKEHHAEQMRQYRKDKPEMYREIECRRSQTTKRQLWKEKYGYYQRNAEVLRQYQVEWRKNNPDKFAGYMRQAYQRRKEAEGHTTEDQWWAIVEYYCPDGKCPCCHLEFDGSIQNRKLSVDHVIPISKGGTHWPFNIQPLCYACNCSKQDHGCQDYRPDGGTFARSLMDESLNDS